jgi:phosphoribosyl-AMP cyclohydrolase
VTDVLTRETFVDAVAFNDEGLVPVIAQSAATGAVLMMAWMNRDTLERTLSTGEVTYWSRSRGQIWRKGETSGHTQHLVEAWIDCDGDALLMKVDQIGPACHTGAPSCFYRKVSR